MDKIETDRLRALHAASTQVVAWYPHDEFKGTASIRGPYNRWMIVSKGDVNTSQDGSTNPYPIAAAVDDAEYAAAAMNKLPELLDELDRYREGYVSFDFLYSIMDKGEVQHIADRWMNKEYGENK